jgi:hypothetical protein
MAVKPVCDFCDKPLEHEDDGDRYIIYKTKVIDTRHILPHLCKPCANKLDDIFVRLIYTPGKRDLLEKTTELNKARRELLGTKG